MLQFRFVTDTNGYLTGYTGLLVLAITNPEIAAKNSEEKSVASVTPFFNLIFPLDQYKDVLKLKTR